jgi:sugar phosphate isomerase/epimerase
MTFSIGKVVFSLIFLLTVTESFSQELLFCEKPGMVSYTYLQSFSKDVAATLDTLEAMGITDMEFYNLFGKTASELRSLLDERGMHCSSFGVGYKDLMEKTYAVAQHVKILGASFVRVASIPHRAPFTEADVRKTISDFNSVGKILKEDHGLTFCYHNHGFEFQPFGEGTLFDLLVQETNPEYVSFEMDLLWTYFPGADPAALLVKYEDRFKLMHVKDIRKGIKGNLSGTTPAENDVTLGTEQLNLPEIFRTAKKAGVAHFYLEDESPIYYLQVPKSIKFLKTLEKD